ncbi:MAG: hypothetical protein ABL986_11905 [Vicinamibacterales bacterium]
MKFTWTVAVLCTMTIGAVPTASAQALADVARQEAARRQAVAAKGKVFTNDDLKPVPPPSPAAAPPAPGTTLTPPPSLDKVNASPADSTPTATSDASAAGSGAGSAPTPAADKIDERKTEKYWHDRVAAAREGLARSMTFESALQARVAALSTDFVNRDDPAQRSQITADREKALAELDRVKKDMARYQAELTTISDEARRAGVPAGWAR